MKFCNCGWGLGDKLDEVSIKHNPVTRPAIPPKGKRWCVTCLLRIHHNTIDNIAGKFADRYTAVSCALCGKTKMIKRAVAVYDKYYCGPEHRQIASRKGIEFACAWCGGIGKRRPALMEYKRHYCNMACRKAERAAAVAKMAGPGAEYHA